MGSSKAPYEVIGLQNDGMIPPVKMTGYGNATPATWPSISRRTSRKGPWPNVVPSGRLEIKSLAALVYQNSSLPLPDAKSSAYISTVLVGRVTFNEKPGGTEASFPVSLARVESGTIKLALSAGGCCLEEA